MVVILWRWWGETGGSESPASRIRSPASRTFVPLCLPTPALHCVAPVFRLIKTIRNPGLTFKLCQNLTFLFIFWSLFWRGDYWVPMKVVTSHDLWRNRIEGISKFTGINVFFFSPSTNLLSPASKFSFEHWWMLNGNFKTLLDECFWLNNTQ